MSTATLTISKIKSKLAEVPEEKLSELYNYVESLLRKPKKEKNIVKMEGIWKDLGFDKIDDLEGEIKKIRKESDQLMIERTTGWNT